MIKIFESFEEYESAINGITEEDINSLQDIFSCLEETNLIANVTVEQIEDYMTMGQITSNLNLGVFPKMKDLSFILGANPPKKSIFEILKKNLVEVTIKCNLPFFGGDKFNDPRFKKITQEFLPLVNRSEKYLDLECINNEIYSPTKDRVTQRFFFIKNREKIEKIFNEYTDVKDNM